MRFRGHSGLVLTLPVLILASAFGAACSEDAANHAQSGATGGTSASGGTTTASGGLTGAGGVTASGGVAASGGNDNPGIGGNLGGGNAGTGGSVTGTPSTVTLSDVCPLSSSTNAWGPVERNRSNGEQQAADGGPLTLGGTIHKNGFGVHAPADIGFALGGGCTKLTATVGIDDEMDAAGSVRFEVWGDGKRLFQSAALTGASAPLPIDVDVNGVTELHLVANEDGGNGSDHADWVDVEVECNAAPATDCAAQPAQIPEPAGYHLVWSDEFDVDGAPNPDNWSFEQGFVRNEEAQWYQSDNASVQAGFLIIEGRREQKPNPNYNPNATGGNAWKQTRQYAEYTSASLHTRGRREYQYGRFEMRGRIVAATGLWPAFWTLGVAKEWPSCGEIDIMEFYNSRVHANVACGTSTQWQAKWDSVAKLVSDFGDDDWDHKFHVWRMDWDDQKVALFLDDQQMNTSNLADMLNADGSSPFKQKHYILVNLALGGINGGSLTNTAFPSRYEVDYVRVFQKN